MLVYPLIITSSCDTRGTTYTSGIQSTNMLKINSKIFKKVQTPQQHAQIFPKSGVGRPETTEFEGVHEFQIDINGDLKRLQYGIDRLFIKPNDTFGVDVKVTHMSEQQMFLRACTCFQEEIQAQNRVETCLNHRTGSTVNQTMNVLRSCDPNMERVYYDGDDTQESYYFSTVTKLESNKTMQTCTYKFVCKNTCESGINRRDIAVIFTLENEKGDALGRKLLKVKVCQGPRRDMLNYMNKNTKNVSQSTNDSDTTRTVTKTIRKRKIVESKKDMEDSNDWNIPLHALKKKKADNQIYIIPSIYVKNRLLFHKLIKTNIKALKSHIAKNNEEDAEHLNANIAVLKRGLSSV
ncbi:cellular tumor antigen p53-like [Achroia grisella]|uniref:cellular tumor antigen p53-like n=1 Tax=Achroia grisella TaxID=688607 RepID=UPI0027D21564|nr:cellular tumor antigen p53-like [Achroia grisella]